MLWCLTEVGVCPTTYSRCQNTKGPYKNTNLVSVMIIGILTVGILILTPFYPKRPKGAKDEVTAIDKCIETPTNPIAKLCIYAGLIQN